MLCPKCKTEMKEGFAIKPNEEFGSKHCFFCPPLINARTLEIISCLKCPKCGYSDDRK